MVSLPSQQIATSALSGRETYPKHQPGLQTHRRSIQLISGRRHPMRCFSSGQYLQPVTAYPFFAVAFPAV